MCDFLASLNFLGAGSSHCAWNPQEPGLGRVGCWEKAGRVTLLAFLSRGGRPTPQQSPPAWNPDLTTPDGTPKAG